MNYVLPVEIVDTRSLCVRKSEPFAVPGTEESAAPPDLVINELHAP